MWGYKDQAERTKARAEGAKPGVWPPNISEFIVNMKSEIVHPFPFVSELKPGKMGPIFEMRYYTIKPGTLPDIIKRWEGKIKERTKSAARAGHAEHGGSAATCIWPYESLNHRAEIREKARAAGLAAPGRWQHTADAENKIMMPAAFSPSSSEHGGGAHGPLAAPAGCFEQERRAQMNHRRLPPGSPIQRTDRAHRNILLSRAGRRRSPETWPAVPHIIPHRLLRPVRSRANLPPKVKPS